VRFGVGLNLAFMDDAFDTSREAPSEVSDTERVRILQAFERYLRDEVRVVIDGVGVTPDVAAKHMFADPDPGMVALFPRTGMRGLIRAVAVLNYPAPQPPEKVEITWPTYPVDNLALEVEGAPKDGSEPLMFLEALLQAEGREELVVFSAEEPTVTWHSAEADPASIYADVPPPPEPDPPVRVPALSIAAGVVGVCAAGFGAVRLARGDPSALRPAAAALACALASIALRDVAHAAVPGTGGKVDLPTAREARSVFEPLHTNLYRAFDYTDESDVYDALARSVKGGLLEELYEQVYQSLVQAEQGGKLGVITGVEPQDLEIERVWSPDGLDAPRAVFTARHRWRVDGTVYHWGHSHTRTHEYDAEYDVAATGGGWRIADQRMLSQRRLDVGTPTDAAATPASVQELLESVGGGDF